MVWDNQKPSNTEKIQDLGNAIRPNWLAIEQASNGDADEDKLKIWSINLIDRNDAAVTGPDKPVRMDDAGIIYCRQDASASPQMEFFFEDQETPANEVQLTQKGSLGSTTTQLNTSGVAFDVDSTTGLTYIDGQFITAFGQFNNVGVLQFGKNMSTNAVDAHPDTGTYDIDVSADVLQNANYTVTGNVISSLGSSNSIRGLMPRTVPAPAGGMVTTIRVEVRRDGGLTNTNSGFYVLICGGR